MECAPTLDMVDGPFEDEEESEEERPEVWGRLFPLGKGFVAQGALQVKLWGAFCAHACRSCVGVALKSPLSLSITQY